MRRVADILHKTAVTGLMGLTALGALTFGLQIFQYMTTERPRKITPKENLEKDLTDS